MHPDTFLRVLGPEPWKVAYCQPSRRPGDGRYGENPMRVYKHYQFQVILKPSPLEVQQLYLDSLAAFGIDPREHDIRFEEDNWESPTLGPRASAGRSSWTDGDLAVHVLPAGGRGRARADLGRADVRDRADLHVPERHQEHLRHPLEREGVTYGDVRKREEVEHSIYSFREADVAMFRTMFEMWEKEAARLAAIPLVIPAHEAVLKCSHLFNVLDARGAISVTERAAFIQRIRKLACAVAEAHLARGVPA
jgi:glycyl-tRNA synthetase alpha chain